MISVAIEPGMNSINLMLNVNIYVIFSFLLFKLARKQNSNIKYQAKRSLSCKEHNILTYLFFNDYKFPIFIISNLCDL